MPFFPLSCSARRRSPATVKTSDGLSKDFVKSAPMGALFSQRKPVLLFRGSICDPRPAAVPALDDGRLGLRAGEAESQVDRCPVEDSFEVGDETATLLGAEVIDEAREQPLDVRASTPGNDALQSTAPPDQMGLRIRHDEPARHRPSSGG